ncbi:MAG: ABC transporter ATP-binding protein [Thermoguttaceae bacterium]|nr:ABC transporter ATP-binding protein [Thermoguttaceae bacterium]MDW8079465.1 ABC transporter ATP-binding protein [Thermoguttaceae bacterium]
MATDTQDAVPMIEAIGLTRYYGDFAAVRDVSFTVYKGEVVALLGPNGAGKSTTLKLLTGYLAPSAGEARIAGHNMATDRLAGAAVLGYLPENGPLYLDMTPRGLLNFFAEARGLKPPYRQRRIQAVIELCDLGRVLNKPIGKLSRGYRQRVGMAQALLHEPQVLIMDEPTAGLDPNQIQEVRETIRRLGQDRTVLLSTHILQEVEAMASRAIFIDAGRLVYDGPISSLLSSYKRLEDAFRALTGAGSTGKLSSEESESDNAQLK